MANLHGAFDLEIIQSDAMKNFFENSMNYRQRRSVFMTAFRKAAKPLVTSAKNNLKSRRKSKSTGSSLAKSLGVRPTKNKIKLLIGARISKGFKGYHGHLVDKGTTIRYKKSKSGKKITTGKMKGNNFWSDALKSNEAQLINSIGTEVVNAIYKWTEKRGITI